ncbi:hypothetical protein JT31_21785 [Cedecea neteri]|uniref:Uncharacterized protein n=1 Tax=Cedecea neteri TaxID=158822 RepID=A0A089Q757_9ENTR|nr:hypothetical protein [Cedecea neteri]AIR07146.1 hypothetical protein JT31_21785 [Cedecea neteri]
MNNLSIEALLQHQADQLAAVADRQMKDLELILAGHRFKMAEIALQQSPAPFVREVFEALRRGFEDTAKLEAGTVDAEEASSLLRIMKRIEKEFMETGKL